MKKRMRERGACAFSAAVALGALALATVASYASTETNYGSGVQAYFGSQSNAYTASNPSIAFTPASAPPVGGYAPGAVLPGLPAQPSPVVFPSWSGNTFSGAASVSNFSDASLPTLPSVTTTATSKIGDMYTTSPVLTEDTSIQITNWTFTQPSGASGYTYEDLNFAASYTINSTGLAGSTPNFPITISGNVNSTSANPGFFQFDEVVNYWWIPATPGVNSAGVTVPTSPGTPQFLGALTYGYYQPTGGAFSVSLTSSGSLAAVPTGYGVLELTGHAWVAGDPFQIEIIEVPEPASISVMAVAGLALLSRRRRRVI